MKKLAFLLVLCGTVAHGAAQDTKKKTTRTKPAPTKPAAETRKDSASWSPLEDLQYTVSVGAGAFYAGGANRGPAVDATLSLTPAFAKRRFSLDLDLSWRMAAFRAAVEGYGTLVSTVHAFPLVPAIRARVFQLGLLSLDLRGGVGALLLFHNLSSDFGMGATRSALGWEAFIGSQVRVAVSAVELSLDVRVGLGESHIPFLLGRGTGVQGILGVRYVLP